MLLTALGDNNEDPRLELERPLVIGRDFSSNDMVVAIPRNAVNFELHLPLGGCGGSGRLILTLSSSSSPSY